MIVNNPDERVGSYLASQALYEAQNGFHLLIHFEVYDGEFVLLTCGRKWYIEGSYYQKPGEYQFLGLSNKYSVLMELLGYKFPGYYKIREFENEYDLFAQILNDLIKTIPIIFNSLNKNLITKLENLEYGAAYNAKRIYGKDYRSSVKTSDLQYSVT